MVGRVITKWGVIQKKKQFDSATKIILDFGCTNNILTDYTYNSIFKSGIFKDYKNRGEANCIDLNFDINI